ncbi:hypothetical protein Tco_1027680 [Tanacetum coccineum]
MNHHFLSPPRVHSLGSGIKHEWKDMLYQKYVQKNQTHLGISKEVGTPRYLSLVVPLKKVGDEAVHKELGDRMERAATTASSLEAEQDSGSGPRCQDTILGDVNAQTRKKLNELTKLCTKLSEKSTPAWSKLSNRISRFRVRLIIKLVNKVKHLEDQLKSITKRRKVKVAILHKEEDLVSKNPSKQGMTSKTKYGDVETKHAEEEKPFQEQSTEEPKELSEEDLKEILEIVPVEETKAEGCKWKKIVRWQET